MLRTFKGDLYHRFGARLAYGSMSSITHLMGWLPDQSQHQSQDTHTLHIDQSQTSLVKQYRTKSEWV